MKKRVSEVVTTNEIKTWNSGDIITIEAGTGSGKSYFVLNTLSQYCKENKKSILFLVNRVNLKNQVLKSIAESGISNISVMTYQKLENVLLENPADFTNLNIDNYDYIVCDESHYFFTDASFNRRTDLFFYWILNNNSICKIFMTATARTLKMYLNNNDININHSYELKTNYSYIKEVYMFNDYETIEGIIRDVSDDEQIIFFSRSAKRALEIAEKFNGAFICSGYNSDYKDKIDTEELNRIIEEAQFTKQLLCATTALDNGINIKESTSVKHIILDIYDRDTFIQCLGRKRIGEGEKITLYFKNLSNRSANGLYKKLNDTIARANYLVKHGQEKYIDKQYKNDSYINTRIVDLVNRNGQANLKVNQCMYTKYYMDALMYNTMLDKKYNTTWKSIIALNLGINEYSISELEIYEREMKLCDFLESIVSMKLYKEEQKVLIEKIDLRVNGRQQKSLSKLRDGLKMIKLPFTIIKDIDRTRKLDDGTDNTNRDKTYWMVIKDLG